MNKLTKLIGLIGLLTLVSCGENNLNTEKLGECLQGDKASCKEVEAPKPVSVSAEITKNGNTFAYEGTEFEGEMTLTRMWTDNRANIVRNGKVLHVISRTTFTMNDEGSSILNEDLTIDPATNEVLETVEISFTETTFEELNENTMIMDDNGIEVEINIL